MIIDLLYIDIQSLHTQVTGVSDNIEKQERAKNTFDLFNRT